MPYQVTGRGLKIRDQEIPLWSGSIHYWRHERDVWPRLLDGAIELGFHIISTYVPWSVHEIEKGRFDFGEADPGKNLDAFLGLCEEKGISVLVRPGPHINAELPGFGFPWRILTDPEIQARTCLGTPFVMFSPGDVFTVPSYAAEKFYAEVSVFFDALAPILTKHQAPQGCITAIQADNETGYFFTPQAYTLDFHPDSIALYRRFLAERYVKIEALNEMYCTRHASFEEVGPPREFLAVAREDLPFFMDWARYKEYQISWALARIAGMWRGRGLTGIPVYHNGYGYIHPPIDSLTIEQSGAVDVFGQDLYLRREMYAKVRRVMRYLCGTSRLPFVPELGCGLWCWAVDMNMGGRTIEDEEFIDLAALMHGMRAANFYMLAERERWSGAPLGRDGRKNKEYFELMARLNDLVNASRVTELRKYAPALLVLNHDLELLYNAQAALGGLPRLPAAWVHPELLRVRETPGFRADLAGQYKTWIKQAEGLLQKCKLNYNISESRAGSEILEQYRLVVVPGVEILDPAAAARLCAAAEKGATVVIGPAVPALDGNFRPAGIFAVEPVPEGAARGAGRLFLAPDAESLERILSAFADEEKGRAPQMTFTCDPPGIDVSLFHDPRNAADGFILFAANPGADPVSAVLRFSGERSFQALWNAEERKARGELKLSFKAYSIMVWRVC